ncbi:MAG: glycosyltransferase family 4 protein [Dysgonamonadaceae bacterium]|jgi:glycosyltransferase involved in cell wall biosynthesis|nr:glycosyltransferase family 4 protein [Dysgonamonadaceae bacterium]
MKIAVTGTRGIPNIQGGVEKHCENLYPLLSKHYNITVFRRHPYVTDRNKHWQNIRCIDLPSTKIKGFEAIFHSLLATVICIVQRPDIVHIHNIGPGIFTPLLRLFGLRIVITYHSPNYEHSKWNSWQKKIIRFSEYCALNFAQQIIFVNQAQYKKFGKYIHKSCWIPNGVTPPVFSESNQYIRSLGLTEKKYILAVGRITPEKGFDYLIKAYKQLKNKDFRLVIAGGSDHSTAFSKQITELAKKNNVILTGFVTGEPLNQLYTHAGLFVLPSYNEGFSIALLEALSYRLPVIISDIPANKEVGLNEDAYFQTGNETELSEKLERLINTAPAKIQYDMEKYRWEAIAEQTAAVYEKLLFIGKK